MNINVRCVGIELTPALRQYVEDKMASLEKYLSTIVHIEVDLARQNHHHKGDIYSCSAIVQIPGDVLKVEKVEQDLYKAIDKVKDHFRELLVSEKERVRDEHRKGA